MAELVESLMAIPGAVAVAHARREDGTGPGAPGGQASYLVYYRAELDVVKLRGLELEAEVISRDLDSVEHRMTEAGEGRFEIERWTTGSPECPHTRSSGSGARPESVRRAGLGRTEATLAAIGDRPLDLERAVTRMRVALGLSAAEARETGPDSR